MAVSITSKPNTEATSSDYPFGNIQDNDGSNNGTPVNKLVYADFHQFFAKMMDYAGVTANDLPDNVTNGFQLHEALLKTSRSLFYEGNIAQSGTAAPTATVTYNSFGTITWSRVSAGRYVGTLTGPNTFDLSKTIVTLGGCAPFGTIRAWVSATNSITVLTADNSGVLSDGIMTGTLADETSVPNVSIKIEMSRI